MNYSLFSVRLKSRDEGVLRMGDAVSSIFGVKGDEGKDVLNILNPRSLRALIRKPPRLFNRMDLEEAERKRLMEETRRVGRASVTTPAAGISSTKSSGVSIPIA